MGDVNVVIEESVAFLDAELKDRDILVELELERSLVSIEMDRDQIKQAFYNVIRNAFQAMKSGGILRIRSGADETHQFVSFSDTGGGIPPENISRVFEPYLRRRRSARVWGCSLFAASFEPRWGHHRERAK
jgi:signal transduction histidine kinase